MTRFTQVRIPLLNNYILVRHGQTDANKQKAYMGRLDYDLNKTGLDQSATIALPAQPDCIFSSPLKRAQQTAEILRDKYTISEIVVDERLIEKAGGEIEGMAYEKIAQNYPAVWGTWKSHQLDSIMNTRFPGGESDAEVAQRLEQLFFELEQRYQGKNIVLVTHSGVIQSARYLLGKTKDEIYAHPVPSCHVELIAANFSLPHQE